MERLLLTPEEAADALSLGRTTIFELMKDGRLPSIKVGRARRILADDLHAFVRRLPATTALRVDWKVSPTAFGGKVETAAPTRR
jgi:excisionase family DNA binding protein